MNPIYSSDSINNNPAIIKQNILSRSIISQNSHIDLDSQKNEVELLSKIKSNQSEDHTEKIKITLINSKSNRSFNFIYVRHNRSRIYANKIRTKFINRFSKFFKFYFKYVRHLYKRKFKLFMCFK